jgi:hypothetical protein
MEVKYNIGEKVELTIYETDSLNMQYEKTVEGKVVQITDKIITIDNGKFKETYQLSQLVKENEIQPSEPYELDEENYSEDIVEDCARVIKNGRYGYLFNLDQLKALQQIINEEIEVEDKKGILKIKLKNK